MSAIEGTFLCDFSYETMNSLEVTFLSSFFRLSTRIFLISSIVGTALGFLVVSTLTNPLAYLTNPCFSTSYLWLFIKDFIFSRSARTSAPKPAGLSGLLTSSLGGGGMTFFSLGSSSSSLALTISFFPLCWVIGYLSAISSRLSISSSKSNRALSISIAS